jgi:hypothetical protein
MNTYLLALYLHIVGALGFFVALGLEWTSVRQMRRAEHVEQIHDWVNISTGSARIGMPSMLLLIISGVYMGMAAWGMAAWMLVTLGAIVLLIILTLAFSRRRVAAIARAVAEAEGPVSPALRQLTQHPLLWGAIQTRVAIALGIVFLMAVKPDLLGSVITIGAAMGIGIGVAIPLRGRQTGKTAPKGRLAM